MGGENLQKYFCRPLPSAAGPAYYYEIYVGGNNPARALVPGERQATLDQGSDFEYKKLPCPIKLRHSHFTDQKSEQMDPTHRRDFEVM